MYLATQLVRGMGSFFKSCTCARQNRSATDNYPD